MGKELPNRGVYEDNSTSLHSDNVASYRTHYNYYNNSPELVQTDLWDFGDGYHDRWVHNKDKSDALFK
jgi:hypothetical protein